MWFWGYQQLIPQISTFYLSSQAIIGSVSLLVAENISFTSEPTSLDTQYKGAYGINSNRRTSGTNTIDKPDCGNRTWLEKWNGSRNIRWCRLGLCVNGSGWVTILWLLNIVSNCYYQALNRPYPTQTSSINYFPAWTGTVWSAPRIVGVKWDEHGSRSVWARRPFF